MNGTVAPSATSPSARSTLARGSFSSPAMIAATSSGGSGGTGCAAWDIDPDYASPTGDSTLTRHGQAPRSVHASVQGAPALPGSYAENWHQPSNGNGLHS